MRTRIIITPETASKLVAVLVALVLLGGGTAHAALTCGRSVVAPGDTAAEVLEKCGEPSRRQSVDGKPKTGRVKTTSGGKAKGGGGREVWVYDLGARQLVRYLTFDRGRLRAIEVGGYGQ